MRNVALDVHKGKLVLREIRDDVFVAKATGRRLEDLDHLLGPGTPPAKVAFEAGRGAWHLYDQLRERGHTPIILDTTRIRLMGVGHHGRKNDALDAEAMARALERNRIYAAHVLSPERRVIRELLATRHAYLSARVNFINVIRGVARSHGTELPSCDADQFARHADAARWPAQSRAAMKQMIAHVADLTRLLHDATERLHSLCEADPVISLLATMPFVALITAATFVSVIDDAHRFKNGDQVGSYLGLVPNEDTSNGPQRLGSITKQGNDWARVALVEVAHQILEHGDSADPLVAWGHEVEARRHKNIAAVGLARKCAAILWAMWKRNRPYDPAHLATARAEGLRRGADELNERSDRLAPPAASVERQLQAARKKLRRSYKARLTTKGATKKNARSASTT